MTRLTIISNMSFIIRLLATFHTISNYVSFLKQKIASWFRRQLGPEPQNWVLLSDGRIISSNTPIPPTVQSSSYMYDVQTNHMTKMDVGIPGGRYRPLSILALTIQHPDVGSIDISDWIGDVRIFPARDITPQQLIELWGLVQNRYVPIQDSRIIVTRNDGSVETVTLM